MSREPFGYVDGPAAIRLVEGRTRFATITLEPKVGKTLPLFTASTPDEVTDVYRCNDCGASYFDVISQCDCMGEHSKQFTHYRAELRKVE